jgi:phenylacetate-CoA ligase
VFTSLTKEALPVIRYRTRDLTRLLPPTSRSMRRMDKITGRSDDMLIIRGVNLFPTQVEELIVKHGKLAPQYQLVVSREGHLDRLDIVTELRPELSFTLSMEERETIGRELEHRVKTYIGVTATVRVQTADSIERTLTGKARRVVDNRPR